MLHLERIARRKLGKGDEWKWFKSEYIGHPPGAAFMLSGGIPRPLRTGPRKGKNTWDHPYDKVIITKEEHAAEEMSYEAGTGNCHKCCGKGDECAGWSAAGGARTRACRRCEGSGNAPVAKEVNP